MTPRFRILLIEDDPVRIDQFRSWLPSNATLVVAASAGRAIGTLRRDGRGVYGGILLDHDLQQQAATEADRTLSGSNLVDLIIRNCDRRTAILVHSANPAGSRTMAERLDRSGFWVIRIPMYSLTQARFRDWVEEVYEEWLDATGG